MKILKFKAASVVTCACLTVLGLAVLRPPEATAATAGWKVNGTLLTGTHVILSTAKVDQEFKLKAAGLTFECPSTNPGNIAGSFVAPNKIEATNATLLGCSASGPSGCSIPKTINVLPTVAEATLDGLLAVKVTIKPKTKTVLLTTEFKGEECALAGPESVTGQASVLAPTGQDERTLQQIVSTTVSGELKASGEPAEVVGSALVQLLTGETWSFL